MSHRNRNGSRKRQSTRVVERAFADRFNEPAAPLFRTFLPSAGGLDRPLPPPVDMDKAISFFRETVYTCVDLNATGVASLPLRLYGRVSGATARAFKTRSVDRITLKTLQDVPRIAEFIAKSEHIEEVVEHPLLTLLRRINPISNHSVFFRTIVSSLEVTGNAYIYMSRSDNRLPAELWFIPPSRVEIIPESRGLVSAYVVKSQGLDDSVSLNPEDIIHIRYPSLSSAFYGTGRVQALSLAISERFAMSHHQRALFQNNAVPDLIITMENRMTPEDRDRHDSQWQDVFGGVDNRGKAHLSYGKNIKVTRVGQTNEEIAFLESRKHLREEIANGFHVPISILTSTDVNKANALAGNLMHARHALRPIARLVDEMLTQELVVPNWGNDLFVAFDDPVQEDREAANKERETNVTTGMMTLNEARSELGRAPYPPEIGDVPVVDLNRGPLDATSPDEERGDAEKGRRGESRVPVSPSPSIEKAFEGRETTTRQKRLEAILHDLFIQQLGAVMTGFPVEKAISKAAPIDPDTLLLFDEDVWVAQFAEDAGPVLLEEAGEAGVKAAADVATRAGIEFAFDVSNPAVAQFMDTFTLKFAQKINGETDRLLRVGLKAGLEAGESTRKLRERVRSVMKNSSITRAASIAQSESARAQSAGTEASYIQSGVVKAKEWLPASDACPFCESFRGRQITLGSSFGKEGDRVLAGGGALALNYSDVPFPPLHPHCRCTLIPVL